MPETLRSEESTHSKLKQELLSGKLSPKDFLAVLMDLDQSEPSRLASIKNVELLTKPEIEAIFLDSEMESRYYSDLGFAYFHKAQIAEFEDKNGLSDFENALEMTLRASKIEDEQTDDDWTRYIKATIAYLENNLNGLREIIQPGDLNESLLRNMVKGLETRGAPSYLEDYSNPRV